MLILTRRINETLKSRFSVSKGTKYALESMRRVTCPFIVKRFTNVLNVKSVWVMKLKAMTTAVITIIAARTTSATKTRLVISRIG